MTGSGRLPTHLLVTALMRRVNDSGGLGVVIARGDPQAGAVLAIAIEPYRPARVLERGIGVDRGTMMIDSTPMESIDDYCRRRRSRDPDLWIVELNSPQAERFIAETIGGH